MLLKQNFLKISINIKIIVEPGRSITGDAGIFLTKVNYVKKTETKNFESNIKNFVAK